MLADNRRRSSIIRNDGEEVQPRVLYTDDSRGENEESLGDCIPESFEQEKHWRMTEGSSSACENVFVRTR